MQCFIQHQMYAKDLRSDSRSIKTQRMLTQIFIVVAITTGLGESDVCIRIPEETETCVESSSHHPITESDAYISCLHSLLWKHVPIQNMTQSDEKYFLKVSEQLIEDKLPPSGFRLRKEYRLLTQEERERVHRAFQILYEEGTIAKYSRLYRRGWPLYRGGPAYLGFHRIFLLAFEEELRRVDDTVSIPYWDVTLDSNMDNPVNSILWSSPLLGNANGEVVTGNFGGWKSPLGTIQRNYGSSIYGRLVDRETVRRILSKCRLQDITYPVAKEEDEDLVLEFHTNGVINWIGGTVSNPLIAPHDPLFFMIHAFTDYVWEMFRDRQQSRCNVNPERDFPSNLQFPGHAQRDVYLGFSKMSVNRALLNDFTSHWYSYKQTANCPECESRNLWCDRIRDECVSHSRRTDYNVGRFTDLSEQFEPSSEYIAKKDDYSIRPSPINDGRTRATALQDAKKAILAARSLTLTAQAPRTRRSFSTPPFIPRFFPYF